jgi:hypothetical protein
VSKGGNPRVLKLVQRIEGLDYRSDEIPRDLNEDLEDQSIEIDFDIIDAAH